MASSFARFIVHPSLPSTYPSLVLITKSQRRRLRGGNWIATSFPAASLQIINGLSSSEAILTVSLSGKILEEHYSSKLHFSWPQIQCIPEIPARGIRAVFVSYKDSANEIQKFSLRFSTHHEAVSFMNTLQEKFKGEAEIEPLNTDFGSDFSPQSEFISSNGLPSSYKIRQQSFDQDAMLNNNSDGSYTPHMSPSFTTLLTNCCPTAEKASNQPRVSEEIDLESQIVKYMEDSSFQDMLTKVGKTISEVGADILL